MKLLLILILTMSFSHSTFAQSSEEIIALRPFASDYCSKWPDGKYEDPRQWGDCCFTHDMHYWIGGTRDEKKASDIELKECVKLSGSSLNSFIMYIGVRIGGVPGSADYSWGFGYNSARGYEKVPRGELEKAKVILEQSKYNQQENTKALITKFINEVLSV
jgi:hypothetical protein